MIQNMTSNPAKFFEVLANFVEYAEEQNAKTTLHHWIHILNHLDDQLRQSLDKYKVLSTTATTESDNAELKRIYTKISQILEFTQALLKKTRNRAIYKSIEIIIEILRLDEWSLVLKALRVVVALVDRSLNIRQEEREQKNKELEEWLLNIAFG